MDFLLCFFKQKTGYEMHISDWISDVCSSDLNFRPSAAALTGLLRLCSLAAGEKNERKARSCDGRRVAPRRQRRRADARDAVDLADRLYLQFPRPADRQHPGRADQGGPRPDRHRTRPARGAGVRGLRSEEHTSELQSLMRISYAVFCL